MFHLFVIFSFLVSFLFDYVLLERNLSLLLSSVSPPPPFPSFLSFLRVCICCVYWWIFPRLGWDIWSHLCQVHGYPSPEEGVPILGEQTVYLNATRRRISSLSETSGKNSKSRDSNSSLNISSAPADDGMSSSQREKTMTLISIPCPLTDDPESQRLSAARLAPSGSSSVSGTSSPMSSSPTLALMSGLSATDSFQSISHVSPLASPSNSPRSSPSLFSWSDTGSLTDMSFASDISASSNVTDLSLSNRSSYSHRSLLDADVVLFVDLLFQILFPFFSISEYYVILFSWLFLSILSCIPLAQTGWNDFFWSQLAMLDENTSIFYARRLMNLTEQLSSLRDTNGIFIQGHNVFFLSFRRSATGHFNCFRLIFLVFSL